MSALLATTALSPRRFVPSDYQAAFFGWVARGVGNAILKAVAGSGKSTSIVRALPFIPVEKTVLILAFNTPIAKEMREKIVALATELGDPARFRNVDAATFHSRGFKALGKLWGRDVKIDVDDGKVRKILKDRLSEKEVDLYADFVCKLVDFAKGQGFGIVGVGPAIDDKNAWAAIVASQDMWLIEEEASEDRAIEIAIKALKASNLKARDEKWIDFNDQLYLPLLWNLRFFPHDWVFVDEAQDTNPVRREFARRSLRRNAGRFVAVGDPCQPAGTLVTMADGSFLPIEKLKVGDKVRSFSSKDASFVQSGRRVNGITEKPYSGKMTIVRSEGRTTRYTTNHYCYALLASIADKCCVYVMRKGDYWRVGTTKIRTKHGNIGMMSRLRVERADDIWVIALFDTERAAKTYEFKVATEYGVPELMFHAPGKMHTEQWIKFQDGLDAAWSSLDLIKLRAGAERLLADHDRDVQYPFNELSGPGIACVTRPMKIRASNFMTGMSVLHYEGKAHYQRSMFKPITVSREEFSGSVWSLDVEKDHTYIADGIATFNCQAIYAFTGASADAMDQIARDFKTVELPLTVSYRCPKAVGRKAKSLVSYFEVAPNAIEGEAISLPARPAKGARGAFDDLDGRDMILCRQTAPLISLAFAFIAEGRGCYVLGKDIGAGLSSLIKKLKPHGVPNLFERLGGWLEREVAEAEKTGKPLKGEAAADKVAAIKAVANSMAEKDRTVPALLAAIDDLFADGTGAGLLTLSTIHKAKGREGRRVVLYRPDLCPSKAAKSDEAFAQEMNLLYVAYTRPTEALIEAVGEYRS